MSATIPCKTKMKDKACLKQAVKMAIKDLFPSWQGDVEVAAEGQKLNHRGDTTAPVDILVKKEAVQKAGQVVVTTQSGQSIVYQSRQQAEQDIKAKNIKVKKIEESRVWIYADIGFKRESDGTYTKLASDVDLGKGHYQQSGGGFFGKGFDKRVQAYYDGIKILNHVLAKGATPSNLKMQTTGADKAQIEVEIDEATLARLAQEAGAVYQPR